jgi:hypothetical protein
LRSRTTDALTEKPHNIVVGGRPVHEQWREYEIVPHEDLDASLQQIEFKIQFIEREALTPLLVARLRASCRARTGTSAGSSLRSSAHSSSKSLAAGFDAEQKAAAHRARRSMRQRTAASRSS